MINSVGSPPVIPTSHRVPPATDSVFDSSNARTPTASDREEDEKWILNVGFILLFEHTSGKDGTVRVVCAVVVTKRVG